MPRTRKTQSGAPAQPIAPVAGQMYGAGVQQQRLQEAMPAPAGAAAAPPGPSPVESSPSGGGGDPYAAAMSVLQGQGGLLGQPTQRPNEPLTTGLALGPGAGPEVLGSFSRSPAGDSLRSLTALTGDPYFAELADRARV